MTLKYQFLFLSSLKLDSSPTGGFGAFSSSGFIVTETIRTLSIYHNILGTLRNVPLHSLRYCVNRDPTIFLFM